MPRNRTRRRSDASNGPPAPRSKQGCITCRIRRKRCDENRDDATDSCQACLRLNIACLGWGNRRPDWCRDKEALNAYKLELKKKLCTRAGTRPSAAARAAAAAAHQVSLSATEESPEESPLSLPDDLPNEPVFVASPSPAPQRLMDPTLSFFGPTLATPQFLVSDRYLDLAYHVGLPQEYITCLTSIIELNKWKRQHTQSGSLSFRDLACRGRDIEDTLLRQVRRASFDSTFLQAIGVPSFGSPLQLWSPDLVPDSTFSDIGSSAPTSPAAPLLPAVDSSLNTPLLFGYDPQPMFDPMSMPAYTPQQPQYEFGALGLSQDFGFLDFTHPQQCILPEPQPMYSLPPVTETAATFSVDNDPLHIHFDACILLLQAVISGPHARVPEIESGLQKLTSKFMNHNGFHFGVEYMFAATVAGGLSDTMERRTFFKRMVEILDMPNIQVAPLCVQVMQESW